MSPDEPLPTVNWPEKDREYRVVQLYIDDEPYIRFPESGEEKHREIIAGTLRRLGIEYETAEVFDPHVKNAPALEGERYRATGMGTSSVMVGEKSAIFLGSSFDYRIGIDKEHLEAIRGLEPDWTIETSRFD